MNYRDLIQAYFERSNALATYWTVYIAVIGAVLGFSSFRLRADIVTTILVTILYVCFAYKNVGAIESTTREQEAILSAIKGYPQGTASVDVRRIHDGLLPTLQLTPVESARNFHIACDLMTIAVLWAKEWRRRQVEHPLVPGAI